MYYYNKYLEPINWLFDNLNNKSTDEFIEQLPDISIKREYDLILKKQSGLSSKQRDKVKYVFLKRKLNNE